MNNIWAPYLSAFRLEFWSQVSTANMHLVSSIQEDEVHKSDSATFMAIMMPYTDPKVGEFQCWSAVLCTEAIGLAADF
jgi:hypothetical protein